MARMPTLRAPVLMEIPLNFLRKILPPPSDVEVCLIDLLRQRERGGRRFQPILLVRLLLDPRPPQVVAPRA
jgi:hypothetical protein